MEARPPKLGAKHKKNNHMPLVGRETKRDKISSEFRTTANGRTACKDRIAQRSYNQRAATIDVDEDLAITTKLTGLKTICE
ncbi:hypothetical protein J6590_071176 [Homalodisca vitripennis]|nr:hypothetical protein J6590_071176 [Homalodisca vitripennis]